MYWYHHGCNETLPPDIEEDEEEFFDMVWFPVGDYFDGVPAGTTLEVTSVLPCPACNTYLKAWFTREGSLHLMGS